MLKLLGSVLLQCLMKNNKIVKFILYFFNKTTEMNQIRYYFITFFLSFLFSNQNPLKKDFIYKHDNLIGRWNFESMTTIKKGKRDEITILYKDKKNTETLTFEISGALIYNVLNDGIKKEGNGVWYAENDFLTIVVDADTTYGTYSIKNTKLILIINSEETENAYEYNTVLQYNLIQ